MCHLEALAWKTFPNLGYYGQTLTYFRRLERLTGCLVDVRQVEVEN
jgi:hypothetical protein